MSRRPTLIVCTCLDCEEALDNTIDQATRRAQRVLPADASEPRVAEVARAITEFAVGTIGWPSRAKH